MRLLAKLVRTTLFSERLAKILVLVQVILLMVVWFTAPRLDLPNNVFEYMYKLPQSYWLSLAISFLVLIIVLARRVGLSYGLLTVMFTSALLFLTPCVMFVNEPGCRDVYGHISNALYIMEMGYFWGSGVERWPGSYIFMASYLTLTGLNPLYIMKLWHFLYISMWILAAYIIAKKVLSNSDTSYALLAPLAVMAFSWHSFHFGKQYFAHILWAVALSSVVISQGALRKGDIFTLTLLYATLVWSHPLTSLLLLALLIAMYIYPRLIRYVPFTSRSRSNSSMNQLNKVEHVAIVALITWIFYYIWTGYSIGGFMNAIDFMRSLLIESKHRPTELLTYAPLPSYTSEYLKAIYLRMFSSLFVFLTGFIASLILLIKTRTLRHAILAMTVLIPLILFVSPFSKQTLAMLNRGVEHALVPYAALLAWLSVMLGKNKHRVLTRLALVLIVMVTILFISLVPYVKWSSLTFMYIPTQSHTLAEFIVEYLEVEHYYKINALDIALRYHAVRHYNLELYWRCLYPIPGINDMYTHYPLIPSDLTKYSVTALSHRYFIEDLYRSYEPPFSKYLHGLIVLLERTYDKIYMSSVHYYVYFIS